ncbi:MAG: peptidylprolyl isomerase [bacterium]
MRALRDNMKYILGIVAVAFVVMLVFSWGMGGFRSSSTVEKGIIGKINGQNIQYKRFQELVNMQVSQLREQSPEQEITETTLQRIRDQVWEQLIQSVLFQEEIRRLNIKTSPEEIVYNLRSLQNIPPEYVEYIKSVESFQTDGEFDIDKYHQALQDPANYQQWIPFENMIKTQLPIQKLRQRILSTVRVTDTELYMDYIWKNEKVNVKYIECGQESISSENIEVPDEEILDYYKAHKDSYTEPEKRKLRYVKFEFKPSRDDTVAIQEDIQNILLQLKEGEDFSELAKTYSQDPGSASKGGDLGYFSKGSMSQPFEEAAFNAEIGKVVGPVKTNFGLHLIKVLDRRTIDGEPEVHAQHILLKYEASIETQEKIREDANYIYEELNDTKGNDFIEIVKEVGLEPQETPFFSKGQFIPGIGPAEDIIKITFEKNKNWFSRPVEIRDNMYIFKLIDIEKSHIKPVDEVKNSIKTTVANIKKKEKAKQLCKKIYDDIIPGNNLEKAAEENSLSVRITDHFTREANIPRIGKNLNFSATAFKLEEGEISKPIEGKRGYYLLKVIDRTRISKEEFEPLKENYKNQYKQQKMQQIYYSWYTELKENAKIKDYRYLYY